MAQELIISNSQCLYRVTAPDIVYIEADGNYSHVVLTGGEDVMLTIQIGKLAEQIELQMASSECHLAKIGRSLIINMDYIYYINPQKQQIILRDSHGCQTRPLSAPAIALKALKEAMDRAVAIRIANQKQQGEQDNAGEEHNSNAGEQ